MNLPSNTIATAKASLQGQWSDTVTITRKEKVGNVMKDITKYSNITCHFSQTSQPVLDQSSTVATTKSVFTLFVDTSVTLITGDTLIIAHKGQTFTGVAGEPFNRDVSNAVKVTVNKIS